MKEFVLFAGVISGGAYLAIILLFYIGWKKPIRYTPVSSSYQPLVSVIIAMRNEETTIARLLAMLSNQNYPTHLFEVIVIDDHSTDRSKSVVESAAAKNVKLVSLPNDKFGKKAALQNGVNVATGQIIITTDADCMVPPEWISTIAGYFANYSPALLLAPVIPVANNVFGQIQALEIFSLQGSTAGSAGIGHPVMCNGANLAFAREVYQDIEHIYSNKKIQSGDDMFLLHELKARFPKRVHYLKSTHAAVSTEVASTLQQLIEQRKRWAAKAIFYTDFDTIFTALVVLGTNVMLLISLIYGLFTLSFLPFGILFLSKSLIDWVFLNSVTRFFRNQYLMKWFPVVQSFYFLYVCFTALMALLSNSSWKERAIKQ